MTSLVLLVVIGVFIVVSGVGSIVAAVRHRPPSMDSETQSRVIRALNRGQLPDVEPDRSLAEQTARCRIKNYWQVLAPVGLAALMLHGAFGPSFIPALLYVAVALVALLAAGISGFMWLQARRSLAGSPRRHGTA